MINYKEKKELVQKITNLLPIQQNEIFNIFDNHNFNYSRNNNGVFINITNIDNNLVNEINNYINFIEHNQERLETIENTCENIYNNPNDDINSIYKIINFEEFTNLKNLTKLEKIRNDMNIKKKKEYHLKFINTMKKYQRLLYTNNDIDYNINELTKMNYLIKN
tara:strand:- start:60 stop:551 length:492 start_codon:yes stop_codon:yes gene_type:complete